MVLRRLTAIFAALVLIFCGCTKKPDPLVGSWEGSSSFGGHVYPASAEITEENGSLNMVIGFMDQKESYSFTITVKDRNFSDSEGSLIGTYGENDQGEEIITAVFTDKNGSSSDFELFRSGTGHALEAPIINTVTESDSLGSYFGSISLFGCVPETELSRADINLRFGSNTQNAGFTYQNSSITLDALGGSYKIPVTFSNGYISGELIKDDVQICIEGGFYYDINNKSAFAGMITADIEGVTAIYELKCSKDS